MRPPAAALAATSVLAISALLGPSVAAAPPTDGPTLTCPDAAPAGSACDLMGQLDRQLGLLSPALKLAGSLLGDLGAGSADLRGLLSSDGAISVAELTTSATAVADLLDGLPKPLRDLIGASSLADLTGTLDALLAELAVLAAPVLEPVVGPPPARPAPTPAPAPPAPAASPDTRSTASTGATGFGGDLGGPIAVGGTTSSIPDVPLGSTLHLGSLAAPEFRIDAGSPVDLPAQRAGAVVGEEVVEQARLATRTIEQALSSEDSSALVAVAVLSALLVGGAAVAQLRQRRHVIPD